MHYYSWALANSKEMIEILLKPFNKEIYQGIASWDYYTIGGRYHKGDKDTMRLINAYYLHEFPPCNIYGGDVGTIAKYDWSKDDDWEIPDEDWAKMVKIYCDRLSPTFPVTILDIHN